MGLAPSFLLYEQNTSKSEYYNGNKVIRKEPASGIYTFNPFNLFAIVSAGIDGNIGERMGLKIEPSLQYGLLETNKFPLKEFLWNVGLDIGYYIRF